MDRKASRSRQGRRGLYGVRKAPFEQQARWQQAGINSLGQKKSSLSLEGGQHMVRSSSSRVTVADAEWLQGVGAPWSLGGSARVDPQGQ